MRSGVLEIPAISDMKNKIIKSRSYNNLEQIQAFGHNVSSPRDLFRFVQHLENGHLIQVSFHLFARHE